VGFLLEQTNLESRLVDWIREGLQNHRVREAGCWGTYVGQRSAYGLSVCKSGRGRLGGRLEGRKDRRMIATQALISGKSCGREFCTGPTETPSSLPTPPSTSLRTMPVGYLGYFA